MQEDAGERANSPLALPLFLFSLPEPTQLVGSKQKVVRVSENPATAPAQVAGYIYVGPKLCEARPLIVWCPRDRKKI